MNHRCGLGRKIVKMLKTNVKNHHDNINNLSTIRHFMLTQSENRAELCLYVSLTIQKICCIMLMMLFRWKTSWKTQQKD